MRSPDISLQLFINGDASDRPVSADLIAETVASLTDKGEFFLVLARDELTYIQTSGSTETGFVLEYQDGSLEQHYSCIEAPLRTSQIVETLQRYYTNHDRWKSNFTWEKEDLGVTTTQKSLGARTIVSVLGITIAAIVIWWFFTTS